MDKVPKYQEIAEWLCHNIYTGVFKPGSKLVSETNLCEKFDISRQTARSAIAILEKDDLVIRKRGSGTYVKDFISSAGCKKVGLMFTYADDYIFPPIISGIEEVLSERGHRMSLCLTHNKVDHERANLLDLLSDNIDGLIVEPAKSALPNPNSDLYNEFTKRGIPCIFLNAYHTNLKCNYIVNNDAEGGKLAVKHLIEKGHTKIAGIFKHDDIQGHFRYSGFAKELYSKNLSVSDQNIIWYSTETLPGLFSPENFKWISERLEGASAVVCYNDQIAVLLIEACSRAGIHVPDDLSVVSFDDSNLSRITSVPLTSITHPSSEMGRLAAKSILRIIADKESSVQHIFKPSLVIRNSVQTRL